MPVQATGMTQSGGLNHGLRSERYHKKMRGWLGEGELEALKATGNKKALEAITAAAAGDTGVFSDRMFGHLHQIGSKMRMNKYCIFQPTKGDISWQPPANNRPKPRPMPLRF